MRVPVYFLGSVSGISLSNSICIVYQLNSVQGSLELASKNFITGATKIVYAIIYSLILVSLLVIFYSSFILIQ